MDEAAAAATNEVGFDTTFWMLIIIVIGVYLLVIGVKGHKKVEENYPEKIREQASKTARKFYLILGIDMIVFAGLEFLLGGIALYALAISAPLIMIIYVIVSFKKYGKAIRENEDKHWKGRF
ncbi:MAG: hypothetical protein R2876_01705 [Eubacteriales bacterium]